MLTCCASRGDEQRAEAEQLKEALEVVIRTRDCVATLDQLRRYESEIEEPLRRAVAAGHKLPGAFGAEVNLLRGETVEILVWHKRWQSPEDGIRLEWGVESLEWCRD